MKKRTAQRTSTYGKVSTRVFPTSFRGGGARPRATLAFMPPTSSSKTIMQDVKKIMALTKISRGPLQNACRGLFSVFEPRILFIAFFFFLLTGSFLAPSRMGWAIFARPIGRCAARPLVVSDFDWSSCDGLRLTSCCDGSAEGTVPFAPASGLAWWA